MGRATCMDIPGTKFCQGDTWSSRGREPTFQCRSSNMSEDVHRDLTGNGPVSQWTRESSPLRTLREDRATTNMVLHDVRIALHRKTPDLSGGYDSPPLKACLALPNAKPDAWVQCSICVRAPPTCPHTSDLALLWELLGAQQRRRFSGNEVAERKFPRWFWAGWMDAAKTAERTQRGSPVKYQKDNVAEGDT